MALSPICVSSVIMCKLCVRKVLEVLLTVCDALNTIN